VVALALQGVLAGRSDLPERRVLVVSVVASLVGLVAAKLYYWVEHRGRPVNLLTGGLCIQGFVLGAVGTLMVGTLFVGVPAGRVLDVTTPGLLFGMTIGRFGCFFGGCCAGRATASRWGHWSSDRRLGVRRIPTQLLESVVAFSVGLAALLAVWNTPTDPAGTVFVGAMAAYTLGRQVLFPLRDLPRHTAHGRTITAMLAALALVVAVAVVIVF
jgi:phosphatidylglycerol:prolipoprotein diacylglycerol transferase